MPLTLTPHHAKYFAHDLTRRTTSGMDRLSMALFDAAVDLTRIRSRCRSSPYSRLSPRASSWPTRLGSGRRSRRASCCAGSGRNAGAVCW